MSTAYSTEKRSRAAKWGWRLRKEGPSPEMLAAMRFRMAMRAADPRLARLYTCDVAESVQHLALAAFPGSTATVDAIAVARLYANGAATDKERLAAQQPIRKLFGQIENSRYHEDPAACALQAAAFTLDKLLIWVVEWGLHWADTAANPACKGRLDYARHSPVLEAMAR
ncbi:MAG: hypothetical protein JWO59_1465 [Chloroflexi bacterium]|nr:hypothetical protein [Chloroflexota bacterium]